MLQLLGKTVGGKVISLADMWEDVLILTLGIVKNVSGENKEI